MKKGLLAILAAVLLATVVPVAAEYFFVGGNVHLTYSATEIAVAQGEKVWTPIFHGSCPLSKSLPDLVESGRLADEVPGIVIQYDLGKAEQVSPGFYRQPPRIIRRIFVGMPQWYTEFPE